MFLEIGQVNLRQILYWVRTGHMFYSNSMTTYCALIIQVMNVIANSPHSLLDQIHKFPGEFPAFLNS